MAEYCKRGMGKRNVRAWAAEREADGGTEGSRAQACIQRVSNKVVHVMAVAS